MSIVFFQATVTMGPCTSTTSSRGPPVTSRTAEPTGGGARKKGTADETRLQTVWSVVPEVPAPAVTPVWWWAS